MKRVFLDANVLFSGSNPGSAFAYLVQLIASEMEAVTSDFALEEAQRNIHAKRPQWIEPFKTLIHSLSIVPSVTFPLPVDLATKDVPILCTAIKQNCNFLVTGDKKDFGHLYGQTIQGVTILWPDAMAKEWQK